MHAVHAADDHPTPPGARVFFAPAAHDTRHLIGLRGLPAADIRAILDDARAQRERMARGEFPADDLRGTTVCSAFFEDSTRTRVSFEIAAQRLGAIAVTFTAGGSSISKGETMLDTLRVIEAMGVDLLVVRHRAAGVSAFLAGHLDAGIINAGDGEHEHPTQGLLDLLTLDDAWKGRFEDRRMAIVGDIAHSRVARSAIAGLRTLGARVVVAGPATLMPADVESLGCERAASADEALEGADACMALRIQRERMESGLIPSTSEYAKGWGIDRARVERMNAGAVVLHPGPVNRNVELTSEVMDGPRSVILDQVANGVAVRAAVLRRAAFARRTGVASGAEATAAALVR